VRQEGSFAHGASEEPGCQDPMTAQPLPLTHPHLRQSSTSCLQEGTQAEHGGMEQSDTKNKLLGVGWGTPVLALLFWEDRSKFHARFPGSKGPSFGGSQDGLAEHDPIPTDQPQSTLSFPSINCSAQLLRAPASPQP